MPQTARETILDPTVLAKLDAVKARHDQLLALLADPQVLANPSVYRTYVRERAALVKQVELLADLRKLEEQRQSAVSVMETEAEPELLELATQEVKEAEDKEEKIAEQLLDILLGDSATDARNVILEVRAGTGGDEAGLFALDLLRMYERYAERRRWKVEAMDTSWNDAGGLKEGIVSIQGEGVYGRLKFEGGGHRVQRVPATEASGRIHTSLATVAILPEVEDIEIDIKPEDIRIDYFCSSGPGGQNVNKTTSAVRMTHLPTGIVVSCQDERSQHKNRNRALRVLRARLFDKQQTAQMNERAAARKSMVGSGDRSEKIRTYNFPQDRVTDHRIGESFFGVPRILSGEIDAIIDGLLESDRNERLKSFSAGAGSSKP